MQKAGQILATKYPRISVLHGVEHCISLFFTDIGHIALIKQLVLKTRGLYRVFRSGSSHGPYAQFSHNAKLHNKGRKIGLLRPTTV